MLCVNICVKILSTLRLGKTNSQTLKQRESLKTSPPNPKIEISGPDLKTSLWSPKTEQITKTSPLNPKTERITKRSPPNPKAAKIAESSPPYPKADK